MFHSNGIVREATLDFSTSTTFGKFSSAAVPVLALGIIVVYF